MVMQAKGASDRSRRIRCRMIIRHHDPSVFCSIQPWRSRQESSRTCSSIETTEIGTHAEHLTTKPWTIASHCSQKDGLSSKGAESWICLAGLEPVAPV